MSWVRIDDNFMDHPKVVVAGSDATLLFLRGLCYSARFLLDGKLSTIVVRNLAGDDADGLAERLVTAGLWERADDGFVIHDYFNYQPARIEVLSKRQEAARRMQRVRANTLRTSQEPVSTPDPGPGPGPGPGPEPSPGPDDYGAQKRAERVLQEKQRIQELEDAFSDIVSEEARYGKEFIPPQIFGTERKAALGLLAHYEASQVARAYADGALDYWDDSYNGYSTSSHISLAYLAREQRIEHWLDWESSVGDYGRAGRDPHVASRKEEEIISDEVPL